MTRRTLTISQILAWVDEFHQRTGKWPRRDSGRISGSLGETWCGIEMALKTCGRGLHMPGLSLAQLLAEQRGVRNRMRLPRFTERQIAAWTIARHDRIGTWPTVTSGTIIEALDALPERPALPGAPWTRC